MMKQMNTRPLTEGRVRLQRATLEDCVDIHHMQAEAFRALLAKYQDHRTNPGAEPLALIVQRMKQDCTHYYLILVDNHRAGAVRVVRLHDAAYRIAPMFILPTHQGNGYAQQVLTVLESLYPQATHWELDTIKEEEKLCYLYEKMGYQRTGKEDSLQDGMAVVYYAKEIQHTN